MALPTEEEIILLDEFKEKVRDILSDEQAEDDLFLLRWLRARDLDLQQAEEMLRNAMAWRIERGFEKKGRAIPEKEHYFQKNYPFWVDGIAKDGRPVHTCPFGKWDARKVIKERSAEDLVNYFTEGFEEVLRAIKRSNEIRPQTEKDQEPITQFICIADVENFPKFQMFNYQSAQTLLKIAQWNESYYPEILHTLYFINCPCPSITALGVGFLKSVCSSKTLDKMKFFGSDKEEWQSEILKVISPEQIRPMFGGTKADDFNPFL